MPSAPPPVALSGRLAVPIDIERLVASVRFDVASQVAEVSARLELCLDGPPGCPVFDLRQPIATASLDGASLPPDALAYCDMGAGEDARMRVVDVTCSDGALHLLDLSYRLGTPEATGASAIEWSPGGVSWDLLMSDLEPGRYLEMWFPANLCHDAVRIELDVEVTGTGRPHLLLANGALEERAKGAHWRVRYPRHYTSLSPLLVLVPADEVEVRQARTAAGGRQLGLTVAALAGSGTDLDAVMADTSAWLAYFSARYGRFQGDKFLAVLWGTARGMEYDGATTTCAPALEHEVFHSWFGRGVKPACASDGWIDEAMASWATASRRAPTGRFQAEALGLDEEPSVLAPLHPWSRRTPREAYTAGSRLLSGLAHMAGGAAQLRSALAAWYGTYGGGAASTQDLARHLGEWCGRDLSPWWDRYVYGADGTAP
ncbi:MAG: hypothetical protein ABSE77_01685 [Acidimicrobiales bacterium]